MARATQELQTGLEDQGWNKDRSVLVASLVTQTEKNLPAMREMQVQFLGQEEEPSGLYSSWGCKESEMTE